MPDRRDLPGVLMVLGAYFPEGSGISFQCRELVLELKDRVRFTILATSLHRQLPQEERVEGVGVYRVFIRPDRPFSKWVAGCRMALRFFQLRRKFEIVHLHSVTQKNLLITCLAKLLRKKLILRLATAGTDEPAAVRARGPFHLWCYRQADLYSIVNSRIQGLCLAAGLPAGKCRFIPDGINVQRFRPADRVQRRSLREELGLPGEGRLILFVGFFSREKRPDLLFRAWRRVQGLPGVPPTALVYIGATRPPYHEVDPGLADAIRVEASQAGLEGRIFFVESTLEIERYYRTCDLLALPSVREGMPNALLEGMACGLLCIATRLPGITDTLIQHGRSGLLFPPGDEIALAKELEWGLLHPEEAREMGLQARETILRFCSIQARGQRVLDQYRKEWIPSGAAG